MATRNNLKKNCGALLQASLGNPPRKARANRTPQRAQARCTSREKRACGTKACGASTSALPQTARSPRAVAACACALVLCTLLALALTGCSQAKVSDTSPHVKDVELISTSSMTEASQQAQVKITFDKPITVSGDATGDFSIKLNDGDVDSSAIKVETRASANAITISLSPASAQGGSGMFALYQSKVEISAKASDGALPSITGDDGSAAVMAEPVWGTMPSGMAIEVTETRAGSSAAAEPAKAVFRVTKAACIRAVTWFSPDGGKSLVLKHNHNFMKATTEDTASDLAKAVNADASLGLSASASGDTVTLLANTVVDGQTLQPTIVEGIGVLGGSSASMS